MHTNYPPMHFNVNCGLNSVCENEHNPDTRVCLHTYTGYLDIHMTIQPRILNLIIPLFACNTMHEDAWSEDGSERANEGWRME